MSDQTSASGEPEENESGPVRPRQSAAERRASETVMLNADNLDDLVAQAKATPEAPNAPASEPAPAAEPAASATASTDGEPGGSRQMLLIIGVVVIIILAIAIAWLIYK